MAVFVLAVVVGLPGLALGLQPADAENVCDPAGSTNCFDLKCLPHITVTLAQIPENDTELCLKLALGAGGALGSLGEDDPALFSCVNGELHEFGGAVAGPSGSSPILTETKVGDKCKPGERYILAVAPGAVAKARAGGAAQDLVKYFPLPDEGSCARATVRGTDGDDLIVLSNGMDNIVDAGAGNDVVISLGTGNDVLCGGPGDDLMIGGAGSDSLFGGPGANTLIGGPDDDAQDYVDSAPGTAGTCISDPNPVDVLFTGCRPPTNPAASTTTLPASSSTTASRSASTRGTTSTTSVRSTTTTRAPSDGTTSTSAPASTKPTSSTSTTKPAGTSTTAGRR